MARVGMTNIGVAKEWAWPWAENKMATTSDGGDIAGSGTRPVKAANAAASKGGVKQVAIGGARDASKPSNVLHPGKQVIVIGGRGGGATDQETVMSSDQLQRALLQLVEKANSQPVGGPEGSGAAVKTMQQKNLSIPLIGQNEFNKFFFVPTSSSASASSSKQSGKGRPPSIKKSPHKLLKIPRKDKPGSASGSVRKPPNCTLPSNKTRLLMKTTPNVVTLSQESVAVAGKAAVR